MRVRIKATRRWFGRKRWRAGWLQGGSWKDITFFLSVTGSRSDQKRKEICLVEKSSRIQSLLAWESVWSPMNPAEIVRMTEGKYILCYRRETEPLRRMTEQYIMGGFGSGWMQSPSKCNLLWIPQRKISLKLKSTMFCSLHPQYVLLHFTPKEYENS